MSDPRPTLILKRLRPLVTLIRCSVLFRACAACAVYGLVLGSCDLRYARGDRCTLCMLGTVDLDLQLSKEIHKKYMHVVLQECNEQSGVPR